MAWINIGVFIHAILFKTVRLALVHQKDSPVVEECLPKSAVHTLNFHLPYSS